MPVKLTRKSFRSVVLHSGLVSAEQLAAIEAGHTADTGSAEELAQLLMDQGAITEWQAQKLLQAKHRGFQLGHYLLQSKLARGGMSTIYAARNGETGEDCVLKVLPMSRVEEASYLPRFQREARIACGLDHPNVIRVFGLHCESDGKADVHFMAMERLHGENLSEKVNREGPLSVREAAQLICQAARGLAYAHRADLVHRDVKPANFVLTNDNVIKVLDLGLASINSPTEEDLTRQYDERVLGTADYLSPEQAVDSHKADSRADIYSLGCTLYFLLSGHPPFPDGLLPQRILAHQTKQPVPITKERPDVSPEFAEILDRMMIKNRQKRIQSADDVADLLTRWLEATAGDPQFDTRPGPPQTDDQDHPTAKNSAPTKTQTDTQPLAGSEADTDSGALSGVYTPEFETFLRQLDEESGIRTVVDGLDRDQELRSMSSLRPPADDR